MVQAWYRGGVSVWDFTDSAHPQEIGFFERGPVSADTFTAGDSWSAYYYNGYIYSNDIREGFDVLKISDRPGAPTAPNGSAWASSTSEPARLPLTATEQRRYAGRLPARRNAPEPLQPEPLEQLRPQQ
jgi:hypothetical protein